MARLMARVARWWTPLRAWQKTAIAITALLIVGAVASSRSKKASTQAARTTTQQPKPPSAATTSRSKTPHQPKASVSGDLIGFGAADAAWNAHHQADGRFIRGAAYDQDLELGRPGLAGNIDRYFAVLHLGGRVFSYEMRFPPGTTVLVARQAVMQSEFPPGAQAIRFQRFNGCAVLTVHDHRLSVVAPNGNVGVEFGSGINDTSYDPGDVWTAIITAPPPTQC
jgi:hypothetical protein